MSEKNINFGTVFAAIFLSAGAASANNLYFDADGGKCDVDGEIYAEFGPEGLAHIQGGNKYTGNGGSILETENGENGLVYYLIEPMVEGHAVKPYWVTVDPKGGFVAEKTSDTKDMYAEGTLNAMTFKPCKR